MSVIADIPNTDGEDSRGACVNSRLSTLWRRSGSHRPFLSLQRPVRQPKSDRRSATACAVILTVRCDANPGGVRRRKCRAELCTFDQLDCPISLYDTPAKFLFPNALTNDRTDRREQKFF